MSGIIDLEDRIRRLRLLRDRIDAELAAWDLQDGRRKRAAHQAAGQRARVAKQREADERLRHAAPDLVRAWAREQGIEVPERGRLKNALREAYLQAHKAAGGSVDRSAPHGAHPRPPASARLAGAERSTDLPDEAAS